MSKCLERQEAHMYNNIRDKSLIVEDHSVRMLFINYPFNIKNCLKKLL
jgi:hypothetical protein